MVDVWTAQYSYRGPDRVDITTRKTHVHGQWFAPIWGTIVAPYRKGVIDEAEYTERYMKHMKLSIQFHWEAWEWVLMQPQVTLVCFCKSGAFCHRRILVEQLLVKRWFDATDKGERR